MTTPVMPVPPRAGAPTARPTTAGAGRRQSNMPTIDGLASPAAKTVL